MPVWLHASFAFVPIALVVIAMLAFLVYEREWGIIAGIVGLPAGGFWLICFLTFFFDPGWKGA